MAEQPTDVRSVLQGSQDVLDAAVATVTATRKTQNVLEQNIYHTKEKIDEHNVFTESHEDIRQQLSNLIDTPEISGPNSAEYGEEASWVLSAVPLVNFISVEKFIVKLPDGTKEEIPASENSATWKHIFEAERNSTITFSVQAFGAGFYSKSTTRDVVITHHLPPDMSNFYCSLPAVINGGFTYTFRITGIEDEDGDLSEITATSSNPKVILSKTSALEQNVDYTLTVDGTLTSADDVNITFKATDARGLFTTSVVHLHINGIPSISGFTTSLPARMVPGSVVKMRVTGIIDPETDTSDGVTYTVSSTSDKIIFSKSANVAIGEDVTVSIKDDAVEGDSYSLLFTFKDKDGGVITKSVVSSFNVAPNMSGIDFNLPAKVIPGNAYTLTMTGATDLDGDTLIYSISDYTNILTFSKTNVITDGEEVSLTISPDAARGSDYTFKVSATDTNGATASRIFTVSVNRVVISNEFTSSLGDTFSTEPGRTYTVDFTPLKDADEQNLTYTYKFNNENVNIESQTANSVSFTGPTEEQLARGESYTLTVSANDGFETVTKDFIIKQNRAPDLTNLNVVFNPLYLTAGKTCSLNITGVSDPDNDPFVLSLASSSELITFNPTSGNPDNTDFTISADASFKPGTQFDIIFTFTDRAGGVSSTTRTFTINKLPVMDNLTTTGLPEYLIPGKSYTFSIGDIVDPEGENVTLAITNVSPGIAFDKLVLSLGEEIVLTVNKNVTRGDSLSFNVVATDKSGAVNEKVISIPVNQLISTDTIIDWVPEYRLITNSSNLANLAHSSLTTVDADNQKLTYVITSDNAKLKFAIYNNSTSTYGEITDSVSITDPVIQEITCFFDSETDVTDNEVATITVEVSDGVETVTNTATITARQRTYSDSDITWASLPSSTTGGVTYDGALSWNDPNGFSDTVITAIETPTVSDPYNSKLTITLPTEPMSSGSKPTVVVPKVVTDQVLSAICTFKMFDSWGDSFTFTWTKEITVTPIFIAKQTSITYPTVDAKVEYYDGFTMTWGEAFPGIDSPDGEIDI